MNEFSFIFVILILLISIIIHEISHGYSALYLGDPTAKYAGRLTLNPLKHIDLWGSIIVPFILFILPGGLILGWAKPVPINPYNLRNQKWGEAIVSVAGPLSNFIIALFFGLIIRLGSDYLSSNIIEILGLIVLVNILLGMFNLIPIPPLDGSKILFAFLPASFSLSNTRMILERYGLFIVIFILIVFGSYIFPILWLLIVTTFEFITGDLSVFNQVIETFFKS